MNRIRYSGDLANWRSGCSCSGRSRPKVARLGKRSGMTPDRFLSCGENDGVDRDVLAEEIGRELRRRVPASEARLRGSLASGDADEWSDIDIAWVVPDEAFDEAVNAAPAALGRIAQ